MCVHKYNVSIVVGYLTYPKQHTELKALANLLLMITLCMTCFYHAHSKRPLPLIHFPTTYPGNGGIGRPPRRHLPPQCVAVVDGLHQLLLPLLRCFLCLRYCCWSLSGILGKARACQILQTEPTPANPPSCQVSQLIQVHLILHVRCASGA